MLTVLESKAYCSLNARIVPPKLSGFIIRMIPPGMKFQRQGSLLIVFEDAKAIITPATKATKNWS